MNPNDYFQSITTHRLQLLKKAKDMLLTEYTEKKAQMHDKWSSDADVVWKTRGMTLAYPSFPPYPDNSMIVQKAMELEKSLVKDTEPVPDIQPIPEKAIVVIEPEIEKPIVVEQQPKIEQTIIIKELIFVMEQPKEEYIIIDQPIEQPVIEEVAVKAITEEPKEKHRSIIHELLKKNEHFKVEGEEKELLSDMPSLYTKDE
jgi:hypothetical protein